VTDAAADTGRAFGVERSLGVGPAAKAAGPIAKDIKARIAAIDRCIAPITLYPPRKA
jgi:hypothetical protein